MKTKEIDFTTQISSSNTAVVYSEVKEETISEEQKPKHKNIVLPLITCVFLFGLVAIAIMIFYGVTDTDKTPRANSITNKHGNPGRHGNPGKEGSPGKHGNPRKTSTIIATTTIKQRMITGNCE